MITLLGTNLTGAIANSGYISPSSTNTWNNAVTTANQTSLVAGTATAVVSGGVATGGEGATVVTGGLSSEVTVPVAVVNLVWLPLELGLLRTLLRICKKEMD